MVSAGLRRARPAVALSPAKADYALFLRFREVLEAGAAVYADALAVSPRRLLVAAR